jgi:hypothetical protein
VLDEDAAATNITPLRVSPVDYIELDQNFSSPSWRGAVVEDWARRIFRKQCVARFSYSSVEEHERYQVWDMRRVRFVQREEWERERFDASNEIVSS